MFQPETEDMLPRMAPAPSASVSLGAADGIVRPQVPEVSILFDQQQINLKQQLPITNDTKPTYEAWKKQMLPKVTFPPALASGNEVHLKEDINVQDYNSSKVNLYPFRSAANGALTINRGAPSGNSGVAKANNSIMYCRTLESCCENMNCPQKPLQQPLRHTFSSSVSSRDVLTICAGTQTDKVLDTPNVTNVPWANFATKKDVDNLRQMLEKINEEQIHILKMVESLILNHSVQILSKPQTCDVAVQTESTENENQRYANENVYTPQTEVDMQTTSKIKFVQHFQPSNKVLQTPKDKPIAQSTTYRPNSPQQQLLQENARDVTPVQTNHQAVSKPSAIVLKSASDTSMAMNELALKYLPNEKLAELLKELNMESTLDTASTIPPNIPTTPVKSNENKLKKGTSDISNASYKYLKKYRLLSEDHEENGNSNDILENKNHMSSYNLPQYNVRNNPVNQKEIPTDIKSPYVGRLPLSPLVRASPPLSAIPPHIVNLDNIKQQPKFL